MEEEEEEGVADVNVGTGVEERERLGEYGPTSRLDFFWPATVGAGRRQRASTRRRRERERKSRKEQRRTKRKFKASHMVKIFCQWESDF